MLNTFLERFNSQPLLHSETHQIQLKYPKHLSKFSLLSLQLNDAVFRCTFLTQIAIFLHTIQNPLTNPLLQQIKVFKLSATETEQVKEVESKVMAML